MSVDYSVETAVENNYLQLNPSSSDISDDPTEESVGNTKNKLGTLNGVFIPCSLNIMGVILFLYLGWGVGQMGVLGVLLVILVAETMALITVSSFSAIVSNGSMQGGGSYFMISRSLGPEFGGSMGLLFYTAYATGVAMYIIGFSQSMRTSFFDSDDASVIYWTEILIGSIALFVCFVVSWCGAEAFSKFNTWMFVIQFAAIFFGIGCYVFGPAKELTTAHYSPCYEFCDAAAHAANMCYNAGKEVEIGLCYNGTLVPTVSTGFSLSTLRDNLWWDLTDVKTGHEPNINNECEGACTVEAVFAILFPMATGIMEGANLSGDLANPAQSIPRGTFLAVGQAIVVYVLLAITMGASFPRETLVTNLNIMQEAAVTPYPVILGILISTLSSALGSLFGGSRVLQAVARDNLIPGLSMFSKGSAKGDEPRRAVIVTWILAQCLLFLGSLNAIAPLASSFFLLSYALCNLTAFVLRVTGAPNFRPRWRFFAWPVSLFGFVMCLSVMVLLDPLVSLISVGLMAAIFIFIWWRHPVTDWGDVSQALMYHQVRKYLLKIDESKAHSKFWRPSVMVLVDGFHQSELRDLVHFCHELKKGGLMVLGSVLVGSLDQFSQSQVHARLRAKWQTYIHEKGLKAFAQEVISPTLRVGYQFLLQGSGLGGLRCNTVVVPLLNVSDRSVNEEIAVDSIATFPTLRSDSFYEKVANALEGSSATSDSRTSNMRALLPGNLPVASAAEYVGVLQDMRLLRKNVVVTANFSTDRLLDVPKPEGNVDVWLDQNWSPGFSNTGALVLQLASILMQRPRWKKCNLRVLQMFHHELNPLMAETHTSKISDFLTGCRIRAEAKVVTRDGAGGAEDINAIIRQNSSETALAFVSLLPLPDAELASASSGGRAEHVAHNFLEKLHIMSDGCPPVAMVAGFEGVDCLTCDI